MKNASVVRANRAALAFFSAKGVAKSTEENDASRAADGARRPEKFLDDAPFAEKSPTEENVQRRRELEKRERESDVEPLEREVRRKLHRSDASGGRGEFERVADGKTRSRRRLGGLRRSAKSRRDERD